MRTLGVAVVVGLSLLGAVGAASAQPYGGSDYRERDYGRDRGEYGSRERGPDYGRRDRDYDPRDRDYGSRDRGYGSRDRDYGERDYGSRNRGVSFDEREYLRCNPDVARAVRSGQMESGFKHFQVHGRREGRKLAC